MGRPIDADALKEEIEYYIREAGWGEAHNEALKWCLEFIDSRPTIELRCEECEAFNKTRLLIPQPEREKGKWEITEAYPHNVYCSECHKRYAQTHWEVWEDGSLPRKYCPNCGADMREGD